MASAEQRTAANAKKADRDREAAQAMREYQAERARIDANTARLRALRLASEAAGPAASTKPAGKAKASGAAKAANTGKKPPARAANPARTSRRSRTSA
jgi:hypothetical protein